MDIKDINVTELKKILKQNIIKQDIIAKIETQYNCALSEEAKRVFSLCSEEVIFINDIECRILSLIEILYSYSVLKYTTQNLIPIIDWCDNNFLMYDYIKKNWCMLNVVDETRFDNKEEFINYLNQ